MGDGAKFGEVLTRVTQVLKWLYFLAPKELQWMMRGMREGVCLVCRYVCLGVKFDGFLTMGRRFFEIPG